jgi:hypothetical protein
LGLLGADKLPLFNNLDAPRGSRIPEVTNNSG